MPRFTMNSPMPQGMGRGRAGRCGGRNAGQGMGAGQSMNAKEGQSCGGRRRMRACIQGADVFAQPLRQGRRHRQD